ncbi:hypothetical protein A3D78_04815 [Candidatus Gottesmanbacteria bacterium RIFCSPHIGHO2_02_FULL_39_14]|uniref:Uncharacterized protein n=2 Tax=Candidatus Gottesmaniibacteriota TaxID=1752720 RepID=A0A1F5ZTY0_9BACT|nr:MAG: hypothetical protein A3D78_04815 [Candidatus Gottesmanbacteria bacterium RIFCSPHIGHO2_02_FULL_39_14]OGG32462.1 MAG: hypothetical protein A3I51_05535 [Candidatus Gottesmanbacteria bacterium RIFCSPLOWO2_02_FULL_38_8]
MTTLLQAAIEAALAQKWDTAIEINKELLKNNKDDIDILARLAFAYAQTGSIEKAKKIYRKILLLDKYNTLAVKNLDKISNLNEKKSNSIIPHERVAPGLFIEEPGKSKTVLLINVAPTKILNHLNIGDTVIIHPKKHSVEIRGLNKTYYGALPDDIAFRLIKFIAVGNSYIACIKNIQKNQVWVFIREISRGKKLSHQSTFIPTTFKEYSATIHREIKKIVSPDPLEEEEIHQDESEE